MCHAHCHRANTNDLLLLNVTLLIQLVQSNILFDDSTSTNKGGVVESEVTNSSSKLASPSSRAVIVRDEDGVSNHSTVNEDKLAHVSKPEVNMDVLPEPKNLGLNLEADDGDDGVSVPLQDTIMDVSTLLSPCRYYSYYSLPIAS